MGLKQPKEALDLNNRAHIKKKKKAKEENRQMSSKPSTAIILLVLIVVILSVALTWSALDYSAKTSKAPTGYSVKEAMTNGLVGVNIQPVQTAKSTSEATK